jgi:FkbM family methyltransferase
MRMSYAQNLEDYHLDLAFAGQTEGVYVDVGGGHPVADNVSYWFYLKGWRGLIVEPQAALADAYRHIRPRDAVYQGLAGAQEGRAEFHAVDGLHGLSSMKADVVREAERFGATYRTIEMPVRRLDDLIADAGFTSIDFLKIDVEGAEDEVLAGIDLSRLRPRVLAIEAVNPQNSSGDAGAWEAGLLAAGYVFTLFDGLNRFYVASEDRALLERFPKIATPWDQVDHLWHHGRAREKPAGDDHALAAILEQGLFALLPILPPEHLQALIEAGLAASKSGPVTPELLAKLTGSAEYPGAPSAAPRDLAGLIASEPFRAALARIACFYDGGHVT